MSKPKEENFFYFPPNPDIPEIEFLSLATDLPHLCLDTNLKAHGSKSNRWFFEAKHTQSKDDAKAKISKITQCITTLPDDSSTKSYPFSVNDFKRLCSPQTWMKDTTVSTLVNWFNMICKKNGCNCCVRSGWSERTNQHMRIDK